MSSPDTSGFASFREFYPFYLGEHSDRRNRRLHFIGSTLVLGCIARLVWTGEPLWLLISLLCGYGFAWFGHFVFEKNKPATFKYPFYSFAGDWKMYVQILSGRIPF